MKALEKLRALVNSGASINKYSSVKCYADSLNGRKPTSFLGYFVRPEIAINFLVEENFAFGINIAYNYCLFTYNDNYNGFYTYSDPKVTNGAVKFGDNTFRNKVNMGWFSFGFGFYYGVKKKK